MVMGIANAGWRLGKMEGTRVFRVSSGRSKKGPLGGMKGTRQLSDRPDLERVRRVPVAEVVTEAVSSYVAKRMDHASGFVPRTSLVGKGKNASFAVEVFVPLTHPGWQFSHCSNH